MNIDTVSDKDLHRIEQLTVELLAVMKHARLLDLPLTQHLRDLQQEVGNERRLRFDASESEYSHY